MAVKQKPNGKYGTDVRDENGDRHRETFRTKTEAKAFEAMITKKKYEHQLINSNLRKKRYNAEEELDLLE